MRIRRALSQVLSCLFFAHWFSAWLRCPSQSYSFGSRGLGKARRGGAVLLHGGAKVDITEKRRLQLQGRLGTRSYSRSTVVLTKRNVDSSSQLPPCYFETMHSDPSMTKLIARETSSAFLICNFREHGRCECDEPTIGATRDKSAGDFKVASITNVASGDD